MQEIGFALRFGPQQDMVEAQVPPTPGVRGGRLLRAVRIALAFWFLAGGIARRQTAERCGTCWHGFESASPRTDAWQTQAASPQNQPFYRPRQVLRAGWKGEQRHSVGDTKADCGSRLRRSHR